jgi:hypothetical protein
MAIQWGRVVLGAFLMEVALVGIAVPLFVSGHGDMNLYAIPPASLILTYVVTVWFGRGFSANFVLQGALIGVIGALMYVALTRGQPEPWQYVLAHALKVIGGAAGGWTVARWRLSQSGGAATG